MIPPVAYAFVSPDGKLYIGKNIRKFARTHGLNEANMQHVHDGGRFHHKGWTKAGYMEFAELATEEGREGIQK